MKDFILHSSITNGSLILTGSDIVPETGLIRGNTVLLLFNSGSEKELKSCYKKLSDGGQITHPLKKKFWGAVFGGLTDKFGNHWLLNYSKNENI